MEVYRIGVLLKEYRTRKGISQEELSFDLCAVSTLSRIESGLQIPGRRLIMTLFSRMGMVVPISDIPMTKTDFIRSNLEYEINDRLATGKDDIHDLLEEYKTCGKDMDVLEEQFYLLFSGIYDGRTDSRVSTQDILEKFLKALALTVKNYSIEKNPPHKYLSKIELLLLNNIARTLYDLHRTEDAINLMEFLRSYFESGLICEEEKSKNYPVILFNLENWYSDKENGERVLELSKKGIETCIKYGKLTQFPYHIFNKGYALSLLGKTDEGKKVIEDSFVIFRNMNLNQNIEVAIPELKEKFGFEFKNI